MQAETSGLNPNFPGIWWGGLKNAHIRVWGNTVSTKEFYKQIQLAVLYKMLISEAVFPYECLLNKTCTLYST